MIKGTKLRLELKLFRGLFDDQYNMDHKGSIYLLGYY